MRYPKGNSPVVIPKQFPKQKSRDMRVSGNIPILLGSWEFLSIEGVLTFFKRVVEISVEYGPVFKGRGVFKGG